MEAIGEWSVDCRVGIGELVERQTRSNVDGRELVLSQQVEECKC